MQGNTLKQLKGDNFEHKKSIYEINKKTENLAAIEDMENLKSMVTLLPKQEEMDDLKENVTTEIKGFSSQICNFEEGFDV
jgi:glutaredoxin-related protein